MNRVRFALKRPKVDTEQNVMLLYTIHGKQVKLYTDVKVKPSNWNKSRQRVKSSAVGAFVSNQRLDKITAAVMQTVYRLNEDGSPLTKEAIQEAIGKKPEPISTVPQLFDLMQAWVDEDQDRRQPGTIKNYQMLVNRLRACLKSIYWSRASINRIIATRINASLVSGIAS